VSLLMEADLSIFNLIWGASSLVKIVMLILLVASFASWTVIFAKRHLIQQVGEDMLIFEAEFWGTDDLTELYNHVVQEPSGKDNAMQAVFESGFREYMRLREHPGLMASEILGGSERAMKVALGRNLEALEAGLPKLATIGSVSPYIGLFGTVWGIMNSFQALGNVSQATLAMVAPGISEALIATAMGLFAAIPAVIGFNHFSTKIDQICGRSELFVEEFLAILQRQAKD
jgi:biopolymer transport protein TolQ